MKNFITDPNGIEIKTIQINNFIFIVSNYENRVTDAPSTASLVSRTIQGEASSSSPLTSITFAKSFATNESRNESRPLISQRRNTYADSFERNIDSGTDSLGGSRRFSWSSGKETTN